MFVCPFVILRNASFTLVPLSYPPVADSFDDSRSYIETLQLLQQLPALSVVNMTTLGMNRGGWK